MTDGKDRLWQRVTVAIPYLWLLVFFLAPFAIILKISFADPVIALPPFTRFSMKTGPRTPRSTTMSFC